MAFFSFVKQYSYDWGYSNMNKNKSEETKIDGYHVIDNLLKRPDAVEALVRETGRYGRIVLLSDEFYGAVYNIESKGVSTKGPVKIRDITGLLRFIRGRGDLIGFVPLNEDLEKMLESRYEMIRDPFNTGQRYLFSKPSISA